MLIKRRNSTCFRALASFFEVKASSDPPPCRCQGFMEASLRCNYSVPGRQPGPAGCWAHELQGPFPGCSAPSLPAASGHPCEVTRKRDVFTMYKQDVSEVLVLKSASLPRVPSNSQLEGSRKQAGSTSTPVTGDHPAREGSVETHP
jgi:hypothetical protein